MAPRDELATSHVFGTQASTFPRSREAVAEPVNSGALPWGHVGFSEPHGASTEADEQRLYPPLAPPG